MKKDKKTHTIESPAGYQDTSKPVSNAQKTYYSLGTFGASIFKGVFGVATIKFYKDIVGLSSNVISTVFLVYAIWNALNDPVFGYLSDRVKWKNPELGQRIPWIRLLNPLLGISFAITWFSPIGNTWKQALYLFMVLFLFDGGYTIVVLNLGALLPDMHTSTVERSKISLVSGIFGAAASIGSILVPSFVLTGSVNLQSLQGAMVGVAIVAFVAMEICAYKVKIRKIEQPEDPMNLVESVTESVKNQSLVALVVCNFGMIFMSGVLIGGMFYFTEYVLGVTGWKIIFPALVVLIGVGGGAYFLIKWVESVGIKKSQVRGIIIAGIGLILVTFMPKWTIYIPLIAGGFGLVIPMLTFNVMIGDLADEDELKHDQRREGMFLGFNALVTKPAESLAASFIVKMLDFFEYKSPLEIDPGVFVSQIQSNYTVWGLKIMFALVPGVVILIGALIFKKFYVLSKERTEEIKRQLDDKYEKYQVKELDKDNTNVLEDGTNSADKIEHEPEG